MISTRRIVAALGLAAGVTGLVAPVANAAATSAPHTGQVNPMAVLDSLTVSDIPAKHRAEVPRVSKQMRALNKVGELKRLNELHQVTDPVAPVTGLLPAVQS
ncbi:hypothetical protein AB0L59_09610 [Streptomyces sp. NPDC052109]|uniref:hypothetical protein n=1 Tax=Streptomyces sp. NPDC052109 TaxID=3155527 RepID=UPI0034320883